MCLTRVEENLVPWQGVNITIAVHHLQTELDNFSIAAKPLVSEVSFRNNFAPVESKPWLSSIKKLLFWSLY